jgi:plasmanylethanolamine desaturase
MARLRRSAGLEPIVFSVSSRNSVLPAHYELTRGQFLFSLSSIAAATLLLGFLALRVVTRVGVAHWWLPLAVIGGFIGADFASGVVHWVADTWGRDDCPLIGPRLLVPFRVHHVNPEDFLRRRFVDTNGEVAAIAVPVLAALLAIPLDTAWGAPLMVFGLAFCGIGGLTNQIHQWAHMTAPPQAIVMLQGSRLFIGRQQHAQHHARPFDRQYCITTGWCNRPLDAIGLFRHLEWAITALTGIQPRQDDRRYESRYLTAAGHSSGE